jgi:hypothetical protein
MRVNIGVFGSIVRHDGQEWEPRSVTQACNVTCQLALEVSCLVLVPRVALDQPVDHADHLGQELGCFCLVCHLAELIYRSTCRLLVIMVLLLALGNLADAFLC